MVKSMYPRYCSRCNYSASHHIHVMNFVVRCKRLVTKSQWIRSKAKLRRFILFVTLVFLTFNAAILPSRQLRSGYGYARTLARLQKPQVSFRPFVHHYACGSAEHLHRLLENITKPQSQTSPPFVVVLVVNYAYRSLALNFVCNLIRLDVTNYVIFAMDKLVFDYLVVQKINTFLRDEDASRNNNKGYPAQKEDREDVFGSSSFVETSVRKSILVLETLKLGYSVLFSDVDVIWIQNPIPELLDNPEDIVIQSDRSSLERGTPPNYKLNSGLYFAKANPKTITAFRAIVKYAKAIHRSEQKAFNYVLCGAFKSHHAGPGSRIGPEKCVYTPRGTTVSTLDLECFPNGSDDKFWVFTRNFSKLHPRVVAIHANYVSGRTEKVKRIQRLGFWFYSGAQAVRGCTLPS